MTLNIRQETACIQSPNMASLYTISYPDFLRLRTHFISYLYVLDSLAYHEALSSLIMLGRFI